MAVSTTNAISGPYTTNGSTTVFPFSFTAPSASEVKVVLRDANGVDTTASGYTVSLTDGGGGSVTFATAPVTGLSLYVLLDPTFTQDIAFDRGAYLPEVVNEANDRAAARDQWLKARVDKLIPDDVLTNNADGKFLAFAGGEPVLATGTGSDADLRTDLAVAASGGGLVGWIANFVGAVARTVRAKLFEMPITPEDFGAVGDLITDDTAACQAWASAIPNRGRARANGTYLISSSLTPTGKTDFEIDGRGTFKVKDGTATDQTHAIFEFIQCQRFSVTGLTLDGNRAGRTPVEASGHLLRLRECKYFRFTSCTVKNGTTDGLYLSSNTPADATTHCTHFAFVDCVFDNCYRNNASGIQGNDGRFIRCQFTNANGTAPQAGIDLESNAGDALNSISDISFVDCIFSGNAGYGASVSSNNTSRRVYFERPVFKNNVAGAINWGGQVGAIVDPVFDGFDGNTATRGCIDVPANAVSGWLEIVRPRAVNFVNANSSKPFVYVHGSSGGHVRVVDAHESVLAYVANFRATRCHISGGKFTGCLAGSVLLSGTYNSALSVVFTGHTNDIVQLSTTYQRVADCRFIDPAAVTIGAVRVLSGSGIELLRNTFRQTSAAGEAIRIASGATVERFSGNTIDGFTGTPINNSGAIERDRDNKVNGTWRTETAITP